MNVNIITHLFVIVYGNYAPLTGTSEQFCLCYQSSTPTSMELSSIIFQSVSGICDLSSLYWPSITKYQPLLLSYTDPVHSLITS